MAVANASFFGTPFMNPANWQSWLDRIYNLRRDKRGSHERPHKPVLLLSIIHLLDRDVIKGNQIPLSAELVQTFRRYFSVVQQRDDQPSIENPFYFLSGDGFWQLVPAKDQPPSYVPGSVSGPKSVADLRRRVAYARFDDDLWGLLSEPVARHQLRAAIIARYFPEKRCEIEALAGAARPFTGSTEVSEELPPGRDAAFRRIVLEVYDYTCAACGARLLVGGDALVEAAHIIPFSLGRNDKPTNGMALCPNHHWAMDRYLISPCPDSKHREGVWRVSSRLDDRIRGQRELFDLNGRPVIPPGEGKFLPAEEGLRWRQEKLAKVG